jgi:hypothetical protein
MDIDTVQVSISPPVPLGAPTWSVGNTRLIIQPSSSLAQNAPYSLTVVGKDVAGNDLTGTRIISFNTTGPAPDTTPPAQLGFVPNNLATGVERTASITILFSEPMDKASVQNAFAITSPVGFNSGAFTWNEAGTEMTFKPNTSFDYGSDISWRVATTATDVSGNPLQAAISGAFRTIRKETVFINFDLDTSGAIRKPDYNVYRYVEHTVAVGDATDDSAHRIFLGFKLDALPENLTRITNSTLTWWFTAKQGDPFGQLGTLRLEPVNIGDSLDGSPLGGDHSPEGEADFNAQPLGNYIHVNDSTASKYGQFDVTPFVIKDWENRTNRAKRSQFRLSFTRESNNNSSYDRLYSSPASTPRLAELELTYEFP